MTTPRRRRGGYKRMTTLKSGKKMATLMAARSPVQEAKQAGSFGSLLGATVRGLPAAASKVAGTVGKAIRGSFKKGGKVKKTGTYKLHKGEKIVPKKKKSKKKFNAAAFNNARNKYFGIGKSAKK